MSKLHKQIVIVSSEFPPQPGGIGNHAYNLALYLNHENYDVKVIADQRSVTGKEERSFDALQPFKVIRIKRRRIRLVMYLKRIQSTYASLKTADHVIATGKFSLWNIALLSRFYKTKTLAVIHGSEVNFKSSLLRKSIEYALKRMDVLVAVSKYTKNLIAHLNVEVAVVPNGINLNEWNPTIQSKMRLKGDPILTTVGRVSSRKGQLNVITQLPEVIKQFPNIHYHCIGIPSEADNFLRIAKQLNVESSITFHGSLDSNQLKEALRITDIFVMLSSESKTGDVEGFGIAILEANAMRVPAIGAEGCGIEDAIANGVSGVLVPLDNTEQFVKAIETILNNKMRYQNEARQWAEKHDWSNIIKEYVALLN